MPSSEKHSKSGPCKNEAAKKATGQTARIGRFLKKIAPGTGHYLAFSRPGNYDSRTQGQKSVVGSLTRLPRGPHGIRVTHFLHQPLSSRSSDRLSSAPELLHVL